MFQFPCRKESLSPLGNGSGKRKQTFRLPVSEDRIKSEHREIHFVNLFPLKVEIALFPLDTTGMIQRLEPALIIPSRPTPGQTEQIDSKRMKSLRHVRLLWSIRSILRRAPRLVNIFHKITIL
ncbi:hypothetical protein AGR1A_Lc80496 [Agrobacterium fabacearum CFBP 5771]|nr:hypothetical protein AGR1C_Lc20416 [Agrobacterium fabacearum TT111]CVI23158.1 hypothetical protein AGR1A_Lc80496 [Agrobacterium fabacearum CFBP 5771]